VGVGLLYNFLVSKTTVLDLRSPHTAIQLSVEPYDSSESPKQWTVLVAIPTVPSLVRKQQDVTSTTRKMKVRFQKLTCLCFSYMCSYLIQIEIEKDIFKSTSVVMPSWVPQIVCYLQGNTVLTKRPVKVKFHTWGEVNCSCFIYTNEAVMQSLQTSRFTVLFTLKAC
jgi:hypothetical protein